MFYQSMKIGGQGGGQGGQDQDLRGNTNNRNQGSGPSGRIDDRY